MGRETIQGRGGRGYHQARGGRGRGRGDNKTKPQYKPEDLKFNPYGQINGKHCATFDTVLEHIVTTIQKTFKHGQDIGDSLLNMELVNFDDEAPTMEIIETRGRTGPETKALQKSAEFEIHCGLSSFL